MSKEFDADTTLSHYRIVSKSGPGGVAKRIRRGTDWLMTSRSKPGLLPTR